MLRLVALSQRIKIISFIRTASKKVLYNIKPIIKMKNKSNLLIAVVSLFLISSCAQFKEIQNTFDGTMNVKGITSPSGEFLGNNSNGIYSFEWANTRSFANADLDLTVSKGSVELTIIDSEKIEVFRTQLTAKGLDSFSGVTNKGTAGQWQIVLSFRDFNGEGSFSVERGRD